MNKILNFSNSPVIFQFFLHILRVPIMYEHRKVTEALGNKIAILVKFCCQIKFLLETIEGV